jgi:hypothetical protein
MKTLAIMLAMLAVACGGSDATKTKPETDQPPPADYEPKLTATADQAVAGMRAEEAGELGKIAPMPFGMGGGEEPVAVAPDAERDAACGAFWRDTETFARAFVPAYAKLAGTLRGGSVTGQDVLDYLTVLDDTALGALGSVKVTYAPLAGPFKSAVDNLQAQRDAAATGFARAEAGDAAASRAAFDRFVALIRELDNLGDAITDICPMPQHGGPEGTPTTEPPPTP